MRQIKRENSIRVETETEREDSFRIRSKTEGNDSFRSEIEIEASFRTETKRERGETGCGSYYCICIMSDKRCSRGTT